MEPWTFSSVLYWGYELLARYIDGTYPTKLNKKVYELTGELSECCGD
jgi:hypothetical protein